MSDHHKPVGPSPLLEGVTIAPCPFCGAADIEPTGFADGLFCLICCQCGAMGRRCWSLPMAVEFWNSRDALAAGLMQKDRK